MWDALFVVTNGLAVLGWLGLLFLPRIPLVRSTIMFGAVWLLCLIYVVSFALLLTGSVDVAGAGAGQALFTSYSIASIRGLFQSDAGIVIGWTHYLAFDLFTGLWIAADADNKRFSRLVQAPFLLATFIAGPVGLFLWLVTRERRARAAGRRKPGVGNS